VTVLEKKQKRKNSPPDEKAWRKGEGGRARKKNTEETKNPCTLPMNRVADYTHTLYGWKNEERPSKVKIPLGP
jgi:hypothetical protein